MMFMLLFVLMFVGALVSGVWLFVFASFIVCVDWFYCCFTFNCLNWFVKFCYLYWLCVVFGWLAVSVMLYA